jgi:hypothetical protein
MDDDISDVDSPEQRMQMRKRHAAIGLRMQAVALRALEELEQKVAAGKPLNMTAEDAEKLRDAGAKLEREALGGDPSDLDSLKKPN